MRGKRGVQISFFGSFTRDTRSFLDILSGFFLEDFHSIVSSNGAEESI